LTPTRVNPKLSLFFPMNFFILSKELL
jgi:hypothetical protein